jgi:hypothetical protein
MFVGSVVVENQMNRQLSIDWLVNPIAESPEIPDADAVAGIRQFTEFLIKQFQSEMFGRILEV